MIKDKKQAWLTWGIATPTLLLNIIVFKNAVSTADMLWALIISLPVFIIALYYMWQISRRPRKQGIRKLLPLVHPAPLRRMPSLVYPGKIEPADLKVVIGNHQCRQPYQLSLLTIGSGTMSYPERVLFNALGEQETGSAAFRAKEMLSAYGLSAGRFVWQIGPGYTGCRTKSGDFDSKAFKKIAATSPVKMIEIRLTSIRSAANADNNLILDNEVCAATADTIFPGAGYSTFRDAEGLLHFIEHLRILSGGKPVGIRLSIINKKEFHQICYAIRKIQVVPDFIVVEGSFENDGIQYPAQSLNAGLPLYEALLFVSQTLHTHALDKEIKVIASGKIISGFHILKVLAIGAEAVFTEMNGFNSREYNNVQDASYQYEQDDQADLQYRLMMDTTALINDCGCSSLKDITLSKFLSRLDSLHSKELVQPDRQILYRGSVYNIYSGKTNLFESEPGSAKEKIGLQ